MWPWGSTQTLVSLVLTHVLLGLAISLSLPSLLLLLVTVDILLWVRPDDPLKVGYVSLSPRVGGVWGEGGVHVYVEVIEIGCNALPIPFNYTMQVLDNAEHD